MAQWQHKERNWSRYYQDNQEGDRIIVINSNSDGYETSRKPEFKEFTDWLDWQCEDGWEVFKISRNYGVDGQSSIWCIFRKK